MHHLVPVQPAVLLQPAAPPMIGDHNLE
jgi:hypothetical protein